MVLALGCPSDDPPDQAGSGTEDGDEDEESDEDDSDPSAGSTEDSESATSSGTSSTTDATSGSSGEEETGTPMPVDEPARGVTISRVEANPGVAIPVAVGGAWVEGTQRTGQIPRLRNTAFRIYLDVDDNAWVSRDIEARLTVIHTDGTEAEYVETNNIAMDSSEASLQSNILIGVLAEDMQPGAQFQVELYEASGDYTSLPAVDEAPKAMAEPNFIGIEGTAQNMKVVVVPIAYDFGGCSTVFDTSDESIAKYEDAMFQQNGLESIQTEIHAPMTVNDLDLTSGNGFFGLLNRIVNLRASESPDPNVYYYGLFDNCGACIGDGGGCLLGVAPGTPGSSMGEAGSRAAIGVQYLNGNEVGIETYVHEIGHTQGRAHVACPGGGAAGADPSFPHADGKIGVWGFGVRDFQIRASNTHTDYMSYCNPTWVSDWQWRATFERIRELSSWDAGSMESELEGQFVLVGAYNTETGESQWWTDRGYVLPEDAADSFALGFEVEDEVLENAEVVAVDAWSEGPWVTVRAPLPADFERVTSLVVQAPAATSRVEASTIVRHHAGGLQTP